MNDPPPVSMTRGCGAAIRLASCTRPCEFCRYQTGASITEHCRDTLVEVKDAGIIEEHLTPIGEHFFD